MFCPKQMGSREVKAWTADRLVATTGCLQSQIRLLTRLARELLRQKTVRHRLPLSADLLTVAEGVALEALEQNRNPFLVSFVHIRKWVVIM